MPVTIFISCVSDEFRACRDQLRSDLTRHNVEVKVQEDFRNYGVATVANDDVYVGACDAVVHLVGDMTGFTAQPASTRAILARYPDIAARFPPLREALARNEDISYTQWEAWLALYHGKRLLIAQASEAAPRGPAFVPTTASRAAQQRHLDRLRAVERFPGCTFTSPDHLAKHIFSTAILDLLVQDYAKEEASARHVAEGFIREMAERVAGDRHLDLDGMKLAVRNAIDIYEREIAGGQTQTNIDAIVDEALARARTLVDAGKSGLARASLRKAAETMRREEEERRERYVAGVTALYNRDRDIALATYDGVVAAEAIVALAEAIHGTNAALAAPFLRAEAATLYEYGDDRGSNVHLVAAIELRCKLLKEASSHDERGSARNDLGNVLWTLGARESGTARLEEAIAAYRAALQELTRERVPLDWATTQNDLGNALAALGERESGTARLEEAVAAYRVALQERTRKRVPLQWAATQRYLGYALWRLGEREGGTARLEEAVAAFRAALQEWTRERVPLQWAATQRNLGNALAALGQRESVTARLEEAVAAYRAALQEQTRERVPLQWAMTQNNLGAALLTLGERESGTARLQEAVAAHRAALQEQTRERVPLQWATSFGNQGVAMMQLAERLKDAMMGDEACQQIEAAAALMRAVGHAPFAAFYESCLPAARRIRDALKVP